MIDFIGSRLKKPAAGDEDGGGLTKLAGVEVDG